MHSNHTAFLLRNWRTTKVLMEPSRIFIDLFLIWFFKVKMFLSWIRNHNWRIILNYRLEIKKQRIKFRYLLHVMFLKKPFGFFSDRFRNKSKKWVTSVFLKRIISVSQSNTSDFCFLTTEWSSLIFSCCGLFFFTFSLPRWMLISLVSQPDCDTEDFSLWWQTNRTKHKCLNFISFF